MEVGREWPITSCWKGYGFKGECVLGSKGSVTVYRDEIFTGRWVLEVVDRDVYYIDTVLSRPLNSKVCKREDVHGVRLRITDVQVVTIELATRSMRTHSSIVFLIDPNLAQKYSP